MLAGGRFARGIVSEAPAGLIDIAPTALALLGVDAAHRMDGRALTAPPAIKPDPESFAAATPEYAQVVRRTRFGEQIYINEAYRTPA